MTLPAKEINLTDEQKQKGFPEKPFADPFRPPDEEELTAAQKYSARLLELAAHGARLTPEEHDLVLALRHEESARLNNDHKMLASALIAQGRFEEAMAADPERAVECDQLIVARDRDDQDRCDCPDKEHQEIHGTHVAPSEYVVRRQYVPQRNNFAYLIRCNECGQLNLAVTPHHAITQYHSDRMRAIAFEKANFKKK